MQVFSMRTKREGKKTLIDCQERFKEERISRRLSLRTFSSFSRKATLLLRFIPL